MKALHSSILAENYLQFNYAHLLITIFQLPCYSPELNLIEILWRFIKYQWIEIDAYKSWTTFVASVEKILREFGTNYVINFV